MGLAVLSTWARGWGRPGTCLPLQGPLLTEGVGGPSGGSWKGFMGSLKCEEMLSAF